MQDKIWQQWEPWLDNYMLPNFVSFWIYSKLSENFLLNNLLINTFKYFNIQFTKKGTEMLVSVCFLFLFLTDAIPTPSKLEVSEISANSALLSWLPGNSSYHHVIYVNSQEVRRVKPGVCSHLLSGKSVLCQTFQINSKSDTFSALIPDRYKSFI